MLTPRNRNAPTDSPAAKQRPRTQDTKVPWHDLQELLRERDFLLQQANDKTKAPLAIMEAENFGRGPS